jgi:predicted RNA-binding Zn-ribbon protein involved in translation (DUF1610 family)
MARRISRRSRRPKRSIRNRRPKRHHRIIRLSFGSPDRGDPVTGRCAVCRTINGDFVMVCDRCGYTICYPCNNRRPTNSKRRCQVTGCAGILRDQASISLSKLLKNFKAFSIQ